MKRVLITLVLILSVSECGMSQSYADPRLQNYHPVSPSVFQFQKYTDIPVSQYSGIPGISIPLYEINTDGVSVPINLAYHAGGIRVNQEASWVGLGWDLNIGGTITQEINDLDDYGPAITRMLPDYNTSPVPQFQPTKWIYINGCATMLNPSWYSPIPVPAPQPNYAYNIYTAYYIPINGHRDNNLLGEDLANSLYYDSEPDIFTANFLGHSIKFIRDPQSSLIIALDKWGNNSGYKVNRSGDIYIITAPSGDVFYFELNSTINSFSQTTGGIGGSSNSNVAPSSKLWVLTKIITKNLRQIQFNYTQSGVVNNYPVCSDKYDKAVNPVSTYYNSPCYNGYIQAYMSIPLDGLGRTINKSEENRFFLNSIVFPNGQINFTLSDRTDILGGKRVDAIQINSSSQLIKSYQFNYSYSDASTVGGNKYTPDNAATFGNTPDYRLKLLSIQDNNGAAHQFTYDPTLLPSKNSFAQDFWGFYNGELTNTSFVPNPVRLNPTQLGGITGLPDNGNNHSARLSFAQAGILTSIKYPTGGFIKLEYELNQFDNYILPDYSNINNVITNGNGLRVHAINYQAVENSNSKRTIYTYVGGKGLTAMQVGRVYGINSFQNYGNTGSMTMNTIYEINGHGFFSSNSLGSGNSVGYDKVIQQDVDLSGNPLGKVETVFYNTPDDIGSSANSSSQLSAALPAKKHLSYDVWGSLLSQPNGTVQSVSVYNAQNTLVKKTENTYSSGTSGIYYGARFFGYGNLVYGEAGPGWQAWASVPYTLIGYYPIYTINTHLQQVAITDYDNIGNALTSTTSYGYNAYEQIVQEMLITSEKPGQHGQSIVKYTFPIDNYIATGVASPLLTANRLTEITNAKKTIVKGSINYYPQFIDFGKIDNTYSTINGLVLKNSSIVNDHPGIHEQPYTITYNSYDQSANLLEYTAKGITNSMLWDYSSEYLTAEVTNATLQNIAATSFEADGKGNWTYSGPTTVDITAPTGKKVYTLAGNSISKSGIDASKIYTVSYWSNNGSQLVNGTSGVSGKSLGNWTYYEHIIANPGGGTITLSGTGVIDELRLYPQGAMMTTYTYSPLIGMTTQCDVNNKIQFYAYDASNRLALILDQDKNVVKKICYNYAGQVENCALACTNFTPDWQNTATALRCQQGSCGNTGYQEQEQKDMNVCSATYNQTRWVVAGYNPTACPAQTCVNLTSTMTPGASGYTASYYNTGTGITYNFAVSTASGLQPLGSVPEGNYTLTISRTSGAPIYGTFKSGCWKQTITGTSATFYNVAVSTITCNSIILNFYID